MIAGDVDENLRKVLMNDNVAQLRPARDCRSLLPRVGVTSKVAINFGSLNHTQSLRPGR